MARKRDLPTRGEMTDRVSDHDQMMEGKAADLDVIVSDVETVRRTIENLDFEGTAEGTEQLEDAIESAEDVTVDVFETENEDLDRIQSDSHEYEDEIHDRERTSESDLDKISEGSSKIKTPETINDLVKAKDVALREIDFLLDTIRNAKEARERSDAIQDDLNNRVHKD